MTVTPEAIRAVFRDGILPEHAPERGGFKLTAEGSCVVVTVAEATHASRLMPVVPSLPADEAALLIAECERDLRLAGFGVARRGDALVVGTDLVDVLGEALGASFVAPVKSDADALALYESRRAALSRDQEAEERGLHEIEIKGDAA